MAHSHSELVDGVRDRIRSFKPDAKLSFRIRELHNLFQQAEEPRLQVEMILEEFYEGFNEIFFSTALQHHSKFKLIKAGTYEWEQRKDDFWGYTQVLVEMSCRQELQANIHILERVAIEETYAQRKQNYLQILLYEMIHAFVQIYTCRCADCFEKYKAYDAAGKTGHGRTWQVISHAVQKFCCNELGLKLDLYREDGLTREIHATRVEMPYRDCLNWELDAARVGALCEFYHLKESLGFLPQLSQQ